MTGLFITALVVAFGLAWQIRRMALARGMMDVPNNRSSHVVPTPRGGGLSFVIVALGFAGLALVLGWLRVPLALAVLLGGGAVAGIGFVDDLYDLGTRVRLGAHTAGAIAVVALLGPLTEIPVFATALPLGPLGGVFTVLLIIWLINLTNFMDGINGISSVHALGFCAAALIAGDAPLALVLGGAVAGFMLWNFPHARVFMGDAGSGFLGIAAVILMLAPAELAPGTVAAVMIALAPFITDATLTLILRLSRGERVFQAHRIHLYQRLSRIAGGHTVVTLGFAALLVLVMGPLAMLGAGWFGPVATGVPIWVAYLICITGWLMALRPAMAADPAA